MESWTAFNQRLELANERERASIESGVKSCSLPDILLTYFIHLSIFLFLFRFASVPYKSVQTMD